MGRGPDNERAAKRITCIQLSGEFPDFCYRLVMPDYGMPVIATVLRDAGYDVSLFVEHVHPPVWDIVAQSDLVCFSTLSAGARKTYEMADRVRTELGVPVVLGGTHATYFIEDSLDHCDYVVLGEGDETIVELADALFNGGDVSKIDGIAYMKDGAALTTRKRLGPRRFDTVPDFTLIHDYRVMSTWDKLRKYRFPLLTMQSSRGCAFHCSYCIVDTMFPAGYRKRDIDSVIEDLVDKRKYGRQMLFVDNDFATKPAQTKALLQRMIEADLDYDITVLTRSDMVTRDDLLELMRRAGIRAIYQGYESIQPETLVSYDKRQSVERIEEAVARLHRHGFRISGSFVLGADTDSRATLAATAQFVLDRNINVAYFFPLWGHYIEQKNGNRSITPRHRAIFRGWPYCDGNFVTHFPKKMRPSQLQTGLIDAHRAVYSAGAIAGALARGRRRDAWEKFIHRVMWSSIQTGLREHVEWLRDFEGEFYDEQDQLREDVLIERHRRGVPWSFDIKTGVPPQAYTAPIEQPIPVTANIQCPPSKTPAVGAA
jgi:anaerobic magnesium-protoporphyrin IX monomethyl ester cyclase